MARLGWFYCLSTRILAFRLPAAAIAGQVKAMHVLVWDEDGKDLLYYYDHGFVCSTMKKPVTACAIE